MRKRFYSPDPDPSLPYSPRGLRIRCHFLEGTHYNQEAKRARGPRRRSLYHQKVNRGKLALRLDPALEVLEVLTTEPHRGDSRLCLVGIRLRLEPWYGMHIPLPWDHPIVVRHWSDGPRGECA